MVAHNELEPASSPETVFRAQINALRRDERSGGRASLRRVASPLPKLPPPSYAGSREFRKGIRRLEREELDSNTTGVVELNAIPLDEEVSSYSGEDVVYSWDGRIIKIPEL